MKTDKIFEILWEQYADQNPSVRKIHQLFEKEGETVVNDHIAIRTVNDPRVGIDVLETPFLAGGYKEAGSYDFPEKKLFAKHFEMDGYPRVFISELLLEEFSDEFQETIKTLIDNVSPEVLAPDRLIVSGAVFGTISHVLYEKIREESEYAAWVSVYGYRANHFTVSVNHLNRLDTIQKVNSFLKKNGFPLNSAGGEVKGSPAELLEQSSTLADRVTMEFSEGSFEIPSCYYEFARRYPDAQGKLFSGFIAGSADKIFESTNFRRK
ncbi:MAG: DUF1338 domain-containing protein [Bacteroidales bacterium]